jgi:mannose-6-phosphate isomerase-like protein (cupin superfamily)
MGRLIARLGAFSTAVLVAAPLFAQQQQAPARARRPPVATATSAHIVVRDQSGGPLEGVRVAISAGAGSQIRTDAQGAATVALAAGTYRIRFDHAGFVTLEREVTVRAGQIAEVTVALDAAPEPPPPPPAPAPPARPVAPVAPVASGPPTHVSIPDFLEKNYIGRDGVKESMLACTPAAATRVLQLRDPLAVHTHANLDEILYVVAGDGVVVAGGQTMTVAPGSLTVIPRGVAHSTERRGRNPLILLSTLAGAPCDPANATTGTR